MVYPEMACHSPDAAVGGAQPTAPDHLETAGSLRSSAQSPSAAQHSQAGKPRAGDSSRAFSNSWNPSWLPATHRRVPSSRMASAASGSLGSIAFGPGNGPGPPNGDRNVSGRSHPHRTKPVADEFWKSAGSIVGGSRIGGARKWR